MTQYINAKTVLDSMPAPFEMGEYVDYSAIPQTKVGGSGIPKIVWLGLIALVAILFLRGK